MSSTQPTGKQTFPSLNRAYNDTFRIGQLSIGLVVPIENYGQNPVPSMIDHAKRIQMAETLGFSAIWIRDVPFNVPSFGDAGQLFDPFVYLGLLAGMTSHIALGIASIILPLRHPAHVAKAAASIDALSDGRLLLGVASGDRPSEYPALGVPFADRGRRFRQSFEYIGQMGRKNPSFDNEFGTPHGMDMLPKPVAGQLPLLITGGSQQSPDWIARNGHGWMIYPQPLAAQSRVIQTRRKYIEEAGIAPKPFMQPLYIDLTQDDAPPQSIHLGLRLNTIDLLNFLKGLEQIGINHVALNLRFNQADTDDTLKRLADEVLPHFAQNTTR